eukprot:TRINITY_DN15286_c0_g5_i1.p1 TRINITY_DN15286_c0_g5~~TRINITY_DN15286_c0_g5_i1.p1  ORF type:complete len:302 (-),score=46.06 TRINITY_DN15286_c0_g5_i1:23-928(-)
MADPCESLSGMFVMPDKLVYVTEKMIALNYGAKKRAQRLNRILKDLIESVEIDRLNGIRVDQFLCYCTHNYRKLISPMKEKPITSPSKYKRQNNISSICLISREWGNLSKHKKQVDRIRSQKMHESSIKVRSTIENNPLYPKEPFNHSTIQEGEIESQSKLHERLHKLEQLVKDLQVESKENTEKIDALIADNNRMRAILKEANIPNIPFASPSSITKEVETPKQNLSDERSMSQILTSVYLANSDKETAKQKDKNFKLEDVISVAILDKIDDNEEPPPLPPRSDDSDLSLIHICRCRRAI